MDNALFTEKHRAFQAVFQLPDIARPVVIHQHVDGGCRKTFDVLVVFFGIFFQEIVGKQQNIRFPLSQRRHVYRKDIQPVVEVSPKGFFLHTLLQVLVGGGDHPDINLDGFLPSDPFQFPLLENPQQPGLDIQADGSDLVQKNGSLVGQFKFPQFLLDSSGKRSFFMSEQFAFDQVGRKSRAIYLDERPFGSVGIVMHRVGHQFLASPALSPDQNRRVTFGDMGDHLEHFPHAAAVSHNVAETVFPFQLIAQPLVFFLELIFFQADRLDIDDVPGNHGGDDGQ